MTHELSIRPNSSAKLETKLFAGCYLTSEIRMHLSKSIQWKHATIMTEGLQIVHYHGKDYLGSYLNEKKATLQELAICQEKIQTQLHNYCPALEINKIEILVFAQVFLA